MYFIIILQQLIASTTHIVAKQITGTMEAPTILLFRAAIAGLAYLVWMLARREKLFRIEKRDLLMFLLLGALNVPLNQFLFFIAINYTSAPNVALAYALTPAFVFMLSLISGREQNSKLKMMGIAVAIIGTFLILFERGFDFSSQYFVGNVLGLMASISWAFYTVLGKPISMKYGAIYSTATTMVIGFFLYLPLYMIIDIPMHINSISTWQWTQILYLGIVTSGIAYVLWYYALKKTEASKLSVFNNLQPILTTILAVIFLHQSLTALFIAGGLLILTGVYITQKG